MIARLRHLMAGALIIVMLFSCIGVYAEELTETVVLEESQQTADEEVFTEEKKEIPRIIGTFEEKNSDRTILYVAVDGNDSNSGTIDAPFATIIKARDVIRSMKKENTLGSGGAVVYIRGGTYTLTEGIEFTQEDSGTEKAPVIYRNYPDEEVEFIGGVALPWNSFKKVTDSKVLDRIVDENAREHIVAIDLKAMGFKDFPMLKWPGPYSYWQATIGDYLKANGITEPKCISPELVVDGKAMTVARYPNDGYLTISEVLEPGTNAEPFTPFTIAIEDNRVKNWTKADDAILTGTWTYSWGQASTQLGNVNADKNRITAKYATNHPATEGQQFYIYNLVEEIDVPGEYYLDRNKGILYLYPSTDVPSSIIYTMLEDIMFSFEGSSYVTLKGIGMKYMRYKAFGFNGSSSNNTIENCEITYTGAISSMQGHNNKILDCWFHDVEGGLTTGSGDPATLFHANNLIENSKFERCDRLTKTYMDAIVLGGVGNVARHNYMGEAQHLVARLSGQEHLFEFNEIADACTNTDDMGALYTGRNLTHKGNVVRFNYFHDIGKEKRGNEGVHGVFFDDWWSSADVVGNVFADITGAGCMAAGSHNVFSNNIFINCGESLRLTRSFNYGNPDNFSVYIQGVNDAPYVKNDLWLSKYPEMANVINKDGEPDMNNNIVATNNVMLNSPDAATSEQIAKTATVEGNYVIEHDPGFVNMEEKNYLLKKDSDVYKNIPEFIPIPFTRMGQYSDRALARVKKAYVYCLESPYVMKNGEIVKEEKNPATVENGVVYVSLRNGAESIGATVGFNEETNEVTVATENQTLTFISNGEINTVKLNGIEYNLQKPLINKNYTNHIALNDLVNLFEMHLVQKGSISVVSRFEALFTDEADDGLLRYLEAQLSIY